MKKLSKICILFLSVFSTSIIASAQTLEEIDPVITEIENGAEVISEETSLDAIMLTDETGEEYVVPVDITEIQINSSEEIYKQIIEFDAEDMIPIEDESSKLLSKLDNFFTPSVYAATTGTQKKTGKDSTLGLSGWISVEYKKNNDGHWLVTKVTGGYSKSDASISVTSQSVISGCSGMNTKTQIKEYTPAAATKSWSFNTGFNQYANNKGMAVGGANLTINMKRGTKSKWSLTIKNTLFQSGTMLIK